MMEKLRICMDDYLFPERADRGSSYFNGDWLAGWPAEIQSIHAPEAVEGGNHMRLTGVVGFGGKPRHLLLLHDCTLGTQAVVRPPTLAKWIFSPRAVIAPSFLPQRR